MYSLIPDENHTNELYRTLIAMLVKYPKTLSWKTHLLPLDPA